MLPLQLVVLFYLLLSRSGCRHSLVGTSFSTLQLDVLRGNAAHVLSLIARLLCVQVCEGGVVEEAGHLVGKASGLFQLLLA